MDVVHRRWACLHADCPVAADRIWNLPSSAPQTGDFFLHGGFLYISHLAGVFQKLTFL